MIRVDSNQIGWCPYRKGKLGHTWRMPRANEGRNRPAWEHRLLANTPSKGAAQSSSPSQPQEEPGQPAPSSRIAGPQNREKVPSCYGATQFGVLGYPRPRELNHPHLTPPSLV